MMIKEATHTRTADAHLSPETLAAYHEDRLSLDQMEAVREHLAVCDDCAAWLLELTELANNEAPSPDLSEFAVAAAWRKHQDRWPLTPPKVQTAKRGSLPFRAAPRGWAVAALLGAVCLGLSWWNVTLHQQLSASIKPKVNPPLVSLEPDESRRATPDTWPSVAIAFDTRGWLILNDLHFSDFTSLRVEFLDSEGHTTWFQGGLKVNESGNIRLEVVPEFLPPGDYRIVVTAEGENLKEPLASYHLRVIRSPG